MRKIILITLILCLATLLAAADLTLKNGKVYSGTVTETKDGMVVLMDGKVLIRVPAEEISSIKDGAKDLTAALLKEAMSPSAVDSHFLSREEYFVGDTELGSQEWIRVGVAKMTKAASSSTNGEAEFLSTQTGTTLWTRHFFKTRVAIKEELRPGTMVICLDTADNGIYRAPKDGAEARKAVWWLSRVTDNSETFKGFVTVGGNYKVALNAVRIVID